MYLLCFFVTKILRFVYYIVSFISIVIPDMKSFTISGA